MKLTVELGGINFERNHDYTNVLALPSDFKGDFKIWRYLSLPKYLKMLQDNYLFLAKLSSIDDPFEGSFPKTHPESVKHFKEKFKIPENVAVSYENILNTVKDYTFINCWHINDYESAAMWSLYSKTNESVAIQSTFLKLQSEVKDKAQLSAIGYIDYEKDYIPQGNMVYHCLFKRKSYSHENEFRVISYDMASHVNRDDPSKSYKVELDLSKLIENVYISPKAPDYFQDLILDISKKYGHTFTIKRSGIYSSPFF